MRYTLHENLSERNGVISNLHGFLNRNLDTGFKSKWSGYWKPPYKFLDYYAIKINGIWLDSNTIQATEYGEEMVFHHDTGSLEVTERVVTPDSLPGFRIELEVKNNRGEKKAVRIGLETGIDIRRREDDIGDNDYDIERKDNRLVVQNSGEKLMVTSEDGFSINGEPYTKEHYPEERQVAFIPGEIVFREEIGEQETEKIRIEFTTSGGSFQSLESREQDLDHELGRAFNCSISSLENLIYDRKGLGVIAGHPWFQNYWARDSFQTVFGLIDAGYFELAESILENFVERGLPGKITLDGEDAEGCRSDTYPLYIIASDKLRRHYRLNDKLKKGQEEAMERLELDGNIVDHDPSGTWMDTLERDKAVEIQSLWLKAAKIMDDSRQFRLSKGLESFEEEGLLKDTLNGNHQAINAAIPLMFDQVEPKIADNQLEKINGEFSSRYGARTRSMTDPGYDSSGYHTGSCWGLTTCWAAAANLAQENSKQGLNFLEKMTQFLDRDQPGALPEVVDAENGELLGCPEQAWSAGFLVHVIDTYLLGIKVKEDEVEIDPASGITAERTGKRVRDEVLDIRVDEGEVEVLNDPDLELRL